MGVFERFNHKEEIEDLRSRAQSICESADRKLEENRTGTFASLQALGTLKVNSMGKTVQPYVDVFSRFNPLVLEKEFETDNCRFNLQNKIAEASIYEVEYWSASFQETAKISAASLGAGVLAGLAAYGGAAWLGKTATGVAIATLRGEAKRNATLVFLSGGKGALGALGATGGVLTLCGIVGAVSLVTYGILSSFKAKERLAEAKKMKADAEQYSSEVNLICTKMKGIRVISNNYKTLIRNLGKKIDSYALEIQKIVQRHCGDLKDGYIDYSSLSLGEKKTLHLSWLLMQIYFNLLTTSLLNANGDVTENAQKVLAGAREQVTTFKKNISNLGRDEFKAIEPLYRKKCLAMMVVDCSFAGAMVTAGIPLLATGYYLPGAMFIVSSLLIYPFAFFVKSMKPRARVFIMTLQLAISLAFLIVMETLSWSIWNV